MHIYRVLKAMLLESLTAGNVVGETENSFRYDGCISTLMTSVTTISIVFVVMCVAVTKDHHSFEKFAHLIVYSLRFCGVVAVIVFCVYLYQNRHKNHPRFMSSSIQIKVKFLWFFGFLFSTFVVGKITGDILCLLNKSATENSGIGLFQYLTELFWILFLTGFLTHFVRRKHQRTLWFNWGISILTLAVLASWSYPFLHISFLWIKNATAMNQTLSMETENKFYIYYQNKGKYLEKSKNIYQDLFQDMHQDQDHDVYRYSDFDETITVASKCHGNSSLPTVIQKIGATISCSVIEFYLIIIILLIEVLSKPCVSIEYKKEPTVREGQGTNGVCRNRSSVLLSEEIQRQTIEHQETLTQYAVAVPSNNENEREENISLTMTLTLLYSCVLFIPQVMGTLYPYFVECNHFIYVMWYGYQLLFSVLFFVSYLFAFYKLQSSCECKSQYNTVGSQGYVFILCSSVDVAFSTLSLIASIFYSLHVNSKLGMLACISLIFEILTDLLQTIFILHVQKYKKNRSSSGFPFENVCFVLASMNLGWWFQDNFGKHRTAFSNISGYYIAKVFYGLHYWHYFAFLALPVSMFYRLHSFIDLYLFYLKFKAMKYS